MKKTGFLAFAIITGLAALVFGQGLNFSAAVDKDRLEIGDQLTLTLTVTGNVQKIPEPKVKNVGDFALYASGRSQNITFVNGVVTSTTQFNFVLVPKKAGTFTVGPAELEIGGKLLQTSPISVTVLPSGSAPKQPAPAPTEAQVREGLKDIFVTASVDKSRVYVSEQVTYTVKFYQAVRLFDNPEYYPPSVTGFWKEDLPPNTSRYETVSGRRYLVSEVKMALFPTASGRQTIGEATVKCKVEDLDALFNRDPFNVDLNQFFNRGMRDRVLRSQPLSVEVLPLPEGGRPDDFTGAVGQFQMRSEWNKKTTEVNEPVTAKITLWGAGNVKSIAEPKVATPQNFRVFLSGSSERLTREGVRIGGGKTFELSFVPREPGSFSLPPVSFSYFDPAKKRYVNLKGQPLHLTVTGTRELAGGYSGVTQKELDVKQTDLRYLKRELGGEHGSFVGSAGFWALQTFPLILLGAAVALRRVRDKEETDVSYFRSRRASRMVKKGLKEIRAASRLPAVEYFGRLHKLLLEYLGDRFNVASWGMTRGEIKALLDSNRVSDEDKTSLLELLDLADRARFSGWRPSLPEREEALAKAERVIRALEGSR
ncbi:MAG: BatD family protein [candidate division Zixibacteria bacterium]|nr:BatD family protein [candidate division Zixibacteria bacterium]